MIARVDRLALWKAAWQRCASSWSGLTRPVPLPDPSVDVRVPAGALQLSLYTSRVSLVPEWEYLGSPSLPPPPHARRAIASC